MKIERVNELFTNGLIPELYQAQLISTKIFEYREIYLFVDAQMRARKISKNKAVQECEIKLNRSRAYIYKALAYFNLK